MVFTSGAVLFLPCLQAIKKLLGLLSEHYVERLGVMYFFNPPTLFWGVWSSMSPLLPEVRC